MAISYSAPLTEIKFLLNKVLHFEEILKLTGEELNIELSDAILDEAAKFASDKLLPLNHIGDTQGCRLLEGKVTTPKDFDRLYKEFTEAGWNSLPFNPEFGGQNLPWLISFAVSEMYNSTNMAFFLCPLLTQGAIEAINHHGSKIQKNTYLPNLISGKWTGTMCLTEAGAGSDLAAIKTKAIRADKDYLIKGQKIFITYGEHDLSENIIHLVLARIEGAPEGVKGISLFIVPKFLEDGAINDVKAIALERKMGIHASPTAVMQFGEGQGAIGYLVGEEHHGLKYMFTMMNNARLAVAIEGLGISESSYQNANLYANERVQGGNSLIKEHPDVQRMLLTMRSHTQATRILLYFIARSADIVKYTKDEKLKILHQDVVDLLTPVAKSHATDIGFSNSSIAMQVYGGMGYIEETGIAQNLRDSRIAMIYEGTNGIQAMDLVMRKLNLHDGRLVESLKEVISDDSCIVNIICAEGADIASNDPVLNLQDQLFTATTSMQNLVKEEPKTAQMLASSYLRLFALAMGGILLNDSLNIAKNDEDLSEEFINEKNQTVEFYNQYIVDEITYILTMINNNS